ncbi:MAG TPA: ArsR family transcriptional regulator [Candidatus Bathyarchaeota archaeon]|nr:ArsR family transcriptional regulator [Candidatus Bathyarchaeota archaeon]
MLIRIVRTLTPEEVKRRIERFEREFGMSFERFEELFLERKIEEKFSEAYLEWAELVDSYKGYIEDGQLDYTVEETRKLKAEQMTLLTPKRIQLLYQLATLRVESINDLAKKVRRNVKNVYQDLKVLSKMGFVKLNRQKGRAFIPETLVEEITLVIR